MLLAYNEYIFIANMSDIQLEQIINIQMVPGGVAKNT